jgi:HNH endonuclease
MNIMLYKNTELSVLDPRREILMVDAKEGDYVWSWDGEQLVHSRVLSNERHEDVVLVVVRYSWKSSNSTQTGYVVCSEDQKFLLRDSTVKQAQYLRRGEQLMPFIRYDYGRYSKINPTNTKRKLVPEHVHVKGKGDGEDVHHDDEDTMNNVPENLIVLTKSEHQRHHGAVIGESVRRAMANKPMEDKTKSALKSWETRRAREKENHVVTHLEDVGYGTCYKLVVEHASGAFALLNVFMGGNE